MGKFVNGQLPVDLLGILTPTSLIWCIYTPSMHTTFEDLELDRLFVIYPGPLSYPIADKVQSLPLSELGKPGEGSLFIN
jgi:hypothetical protein